MEDYSAAIPVELWHMVFSLLSFEDLKSCRLVCKHWIDLVKSLREYVSKNCLRLEYCTLSENEPPLTVLQDSSLKFSGLIVGDKMRLEFSPNLPMRLAEIAETVTYLDLSKLDSESRIIRLFVENLSFYKVLNQLKLSHMSSLLDAAFRERSFDVSLQGVLEKLMEKHRWEVITREDVQEFFEHEKLEIFLEKSALEGYKDVVVEEVSNNLDQLNDGNLIIRELSDIIANKLGDLEKEASTSLSRSRNENVRTLTVLYIRKPISDCGFYYNSPSIDDLGLILQLLPNLQEFQILESVSCRDSSLLEFIEVYMDKTTQYSVDFDYFDQLNICSLPCLKDLKCLKLENNDFDSLANLDVASFLEKYPNLISIGLCEFSLPQDNFEYFTEFTLDLSLVSNLNLTNLCLFKNLSYLHLFNDDWPTRCFMNHHPFILESMKTLKFEIIRKYCKDCFYTLLKAFPNLSHLQFEGKSEDVDNIFQCQPDLAQLEICVQRMNLKNSHWPEMKRLQKLELACNEIVGDKDDWGRFIKNMDRLKHLVIYSDNFLEIQTIFQAGNMPWLQQVEFNETDKNYQEIFVRNGRKVLVEFHPIEYEGGDDDYSDENDDDTES